MSMKKPISLDELRVGVPFTITIPTKVERFLKKRWKECEFTEDVKPFAGFVADWFALEMAALQWIKDEDPEVYSQAVGEVSKMCFAGIIAGLLAPKEHNN